MNMPDKVMVSNQILDRVIVFLKTPGLSDKIFHVVTEIDGKAEQFHLKK